MGTYNVNTDEIAKLFGSAAAIFGAIGLLWKKVAKPMFTSYQYATEMLSKLEEISSELRPNGGGSIKDALNRIESRQIKAESRTRALLIDSDSGTWESDENGLCIWWNRTLHEMLGRSPEGMNWIASVSTEERDEVSHDWDEAVRKKREFYKQITYITPHDVKTVCTVKAYPLLDKDRIVRGWVGIATRVKPHAN